MARRRAATWTTRSRRRPINQALAYCQGLVERPADTILVLISDLYEGGIAEKMLRRTSANVDSGTTMIALALSDSGRPSYDAAQAAALAGSGCPPSPARLTSSRT